LVTGYQFSIGRLLALQHPAYYFIITKSGWHSVYKTTVKVFGLQ